MSRVILILPFLLLLGCQQNKPSIVVETKTEYVYPSEGLLIACIKTTPVPEVLTRDVYINRDLYHAGEDSCAAKMQKIINWYKESRSLTKSAP